MFKTKFQKIISIFSLIIIIVIGIYFFLVGPVSRNRTLKKIDITNGASYLTIAQLLKENKLIRSTFGYKIYIKVHKPKPIDACSYYLSENMGVKKIVKILSTSCKGDPSAIKITFKEGINIRQMAKLIASKTNNSEDSVYELLKDNEYLDELIEKYWFLTNEIKNEDIFYPLEGYLFPNTYEFANKDVEIKTIFEKMLKETDKQLKPFKETIENSEFSLHEFLTLVSIVELESSDCNDRAGIAQVFYNRLRDNWSLGSDVTTYYGLKKEMSEHNLTIKELNEYNAYNTRCVKMKTLPIGPICNSGINAILATLNPKEHNYYYFAADKNGKTYFTVTEKEHNQVIKELKEEKLWFAPKS